ncbi:MAG: zf-HC2 domain-containing protein [Acidobacteria bacterium]|nr:zf-HC2 domain-containing protein [Acidobacteriota bacterium]
MEKSNHIEDTAINQLLQSYFKQQPPTEFHCEGFDADIASLYLERVLTAPETSRYEIHLFQCSPCRFNVIALARLMEQEVPAIISAAAEEPAAIHTTIATEQASSSATRNGFAERLKGWLGLLTTPGFALAAVATLVVAISIPLLISQKRNSSPNATAQSPATTSSADHDRQSAQSRAANSEESVGNTATKETNPAAPKPEAYVGDNTNNQPARNSDEGAAAAGAVAGFTPPATEPALAKDAKEETKSDTSTVAENRAHADDRQARASEPTAIVATAPPAQPAKPATPEKKELGHIDASKALRVPETDKEVAAKTIKPGVTSGDVTARNNHSKGATIRPSDNDAQPPATATGDANRPAGLAEKSTSLRDERDVRKEKLRASASRKVHDKTFFLLDDIWTDQKYSKDKELPFVTVIKDSEVYKGLLEKYSSLQKFFNGFAANEKVIVVYKGTAYKRIPPDGN